MRSYLLILLLLWLLFPFYSRSQSYIYDYITTAQGLSSNRVRAVIQDREGFYWIATTNGLNRFDGSSFKIFRHENNNPASLAHNTCFDLLEDIEGNIWVSTYNGISIYKKSVNHFLNIELKEEGISQDILNRSIIKLVADDAGNIWIASLGLYKFDIRKKKMFSFSNHKDYPGDYNDANRVTAIYYDQLRNGIWFQSGQELNFFDIAPGSFYHKRQNPKNWVIFEKSVFPLAFDHDNRLWFLEEDRKISLFSSLNNRIEKTGVSPGGSIKTTVTDDKNRFWISYWSDSTAVYDHTTQKTDLVFFQQNHSRSVIDKSFSDLFVDKENNYWVSSNNGISIYNPSRQFYNLYELNIMGKSHDNLPFYITAIAPGAKNDLWIGSTMGLFRYQTDTRRAEKIEIPQLKKYINALYLDGDSVLWVSNKRMMHKYDIKKNRIPVSVQLNKSHFQVISKGPYDHIWAGTWSDGLYEITAGGKIVNHYKRNDSITGSLSSNKYLSLNYSNGELWMGFNGGEGFSKFDAVSRKFIQFKININGLSESPTINVVATEKLKEVWLGTHGDGIYVWNREQNKYRHFKSGDGLGSGFINSIRNDKNNNKWISTSTGIDFYNASTQKINPVVPDFSLNNEDFFQNSGINKEGKLFFFARNKIIEIDPVRYQDNRFSYPVMITDFRVFDSIFPISFGQKKIRLSHKQNFFSFEFSTLKANATELIKYACMLEGFDEDWQFTGSRRFAAYTNVPAGKYQFKVKAINERGEWDEKFAVIEIIITPPFWKTIWFYTSFFLLTVFTILIIVRRRVKQVRRTAQQRMKLIVATQEKEKKSISAELHDDLGVRLSALKYFITSLKKYFPSDNPQAMETYEKVLATVDESVDDIRYMLINLSPKTLTEYGYLTAVEDLVSKLSKLHIIDVELKQSGLEQRLHPDTEAGLYRITQELINNTLKHAHAKMIRLEIERNNGQLILKYSDDGTGFDPMTKSKGYGMENIHTRVALLKGKIEWDSANGRFTKVKITIPYNHTLV